MTNRGYIALHRKIQDNFLWKKKRRFSLAEAWIDILMEAQHSEQPQQVLCGMTVLLCHYGQSLKSITTWGKRWGWSRNKVHRFFRLLENCSMIATKNEQVTTRLTVCNYRQYDPKQNANKTQTERRQNEDRTPADTDNNDKNENNEKNEHIKPASSRFEFKSFEQLSSEQAQQALLQAGKEFLGDGKD